MTCDFKVGDRVIIKNVASNVNIFPSRYYNSIATVVRIRPPTGYSMAVLVYVKFDTGKIEGGWLQQRFELCIPKEPDWEV